MLLVIEMAPGMESLFILQIVHFAPTTKLEKVTQMLFEFWLWHFGRDYGERLAAQQMELFGHTTLKPTKTTEMKPKPFTHFFQSSLSLPCQDSFAMYINPTI